VPSWLLVALANAFLGGLCIMQWFLFLQNLLIPELLVDLN
jgi:hypothetical protein